MTNGPRPGNPNPKPSGPPGRPWETERARRIAEIVDAAPPLTEAQRHAIGLLLAPPTLVTTA